MKRGRYIFGFDVWGLLLFVVVMVPNIVWFAIPAPDDVLRTNSSTPLLEVVASVLQVLTIVCLCFVVNKESGRLYLSPLIKATVACVVFYYAGWGLYYSGVIGTGVILLLTVPPCLAFVLFAIDRRNLPAAVFAIGFAVCHLTFAIINFML